jgi:hypothetical protein
MTDALKFGVLLAMGEFFPCGSRVTCNPPPVDTDEDWLVHTENALAFREVALDVGFNIGGSLFLDAQCPLNADDRFSSYMRGDENLIVTQDRHFFDKFKAASSVAKRLNLLDKADRIALFQAVLYANSCDREEEVQNERP